VHSLDSILWYIAAAKIVAVEVASFIGLVFVLWTAIRHEIKRLSSK